MDAPSPAGRVYDYKALIGVYISARASERRAGIDPFERECHKHYSALLAKLEGLFGVVLSEWFAVPEGNRRACSIYPFFRTAVDSLLAITTPLDGWDEAGVLKDIDECGDVGREARRALEATRRLSAASRGTHYRLLYALFECMYGRVTTVVSSEQLRRAGFDDSKGPVPDPYD
jgi:hypothetical protein